MDSRVDVCKLRSRQKGIFEGLQNQTWSESGDIEQNKSKIIEGHEYGRGFEMKDNEDYKLTILLCNEWGRCRRGHGNHRISKN